MSYDADYSTLLSLFMRLVDSQAGEKLGPEDAWLNDAQVLAKKLFGHLVSMQSIASVTKVDNSENQTIVFVDHPSVKVVGRAALETYLVFYYLYGNQDFSLSKFRHNTWHLAGLIDRQNHRISTLEGFETQAREKGSIEEIKEEIQTSSHFLKYTKKQRKGLLQSNWRLGISWVGIGMSAGFHEKYFRNIYSYFCGYAHSSYSSALQVREACSVKDQQMITQPILGIGVVLVAHFAFAYSSVFKQAEAVLPADRLAQGVAEKWRFGQEDMAEIYDHP